MCVLYTVCDVVNLTKRGEVSFWFAFLMWAAREKFWVYKTINNKCKVFQITKAN